MRIAIQTALLLAIVALAFLKGGRPEKSVAAVMVSMLLIDYPNHFFFGYGSYESVDIGHLVIDTVALVALVVIALQADRFWTLWVASAQLISVVSHVLRLLAVEMNPFIYAVMNRWPFAVMMLVLLTGTLLHIRRSSSARMTPVS